VLATGAFTLALAFLPFAAGWVALAAWLGRRQGTLANAVDPPD
jgi:hypothetical protein